MTSSIPDAFSKPRKTRGASFEPHVAAALGRVIRARREAADLPQDKFAYAAGVDRSFYGKLERGERQPSIGVLLRIARALNCSGSEILAEAETLLATEYK
ncbi:anaerobic benzoate catabolism transcriptional regulator [compost metagenome]